MVAAGFSLRVFCANKSWLQYFWSVKTSCAKNAGRKNQKYYALRKQEATASASAKKLLTY